MGRRENSEANWLLRLGLAAILLIIVCSVSCASCTLVEPGMVGIQVSRAGANRGVQDAPIVSGWVSYNPLTETVIEFPTTTQTETWTASRTEGSARDESITFSSRDGVVISADVSISYHVDAAKAGRLYTRFRTNNLRDLAHGYVRNLVRDALNETAATLSVEEIYGVKKTQLLNSARELLESRHHMRSDGFIVDQLSFQGALRLPPSIVEAINQAQQATQNAQRARNQVAITRAEAESVQARVAGEAAQALTRAEGEARAARTRAEGEAEAMRIRTQAEAAREIALARARADANRLVAPTLTPLIIQQERIQRWNGTLPTTAGVGVVPLGNLSPTTP